MNDYAPNFDREGKRVTFGFLARLLALGGVDVGQGLRRWLALAVLVVGLRVGRSAEVQERLRGARAQL